ncbi:UDP-N-acetylmuramoyl-L-alanine--D-glutamate ligase [Synergistes jonesii]|uniref:UDP-N-acetylmuramoyl-L-alanine--D-glutamate ligase n=1 Tax=Synergistes jonesii TaxID=2754 RepID=UPI00242F016A|nr:UDP-N-acetylmuramoyl-L-alanine--D-glutamate ligase [Synergistes jonesii]
MSMEENKELSGRRISVIGAGVSGRALAELAAELGAEVFVSDKNEIAPEIVESFGEKNIKWEEGGNSERALAADEIIVSSGLSPDVPILAEAREKGIKITGELDFVSPYLNGIVIGVTGSNGKTTTTSMIGYYLEGMGYSVMAGGNIGNAVAKAANKFYDFIVLELSSFQLYWAKDFICDIGVVTNLAPDHIDWHGSYENYVAAKAKLLKCVAPGGAAIYQKRDEEALDIREDIKKFPLFWGEESPHVRGIYLDEGVKAAWINGGDCRMKNKLFFFENVKLLGKHNLENAAMALGAIALFNLGEVPEELIGSYVPPKHRCAFAGSVKGITFVDDSKGTNVAAAIAAMTSLSGPKVVILGGQGKGEDYAPLALAVKNYARAAVILGSEKKKIAAALDAVGAAGYKLAADMPEAVNAAYSLAEAGDTVLLSPACTSWDMYKSYNDRGEHFCAIAKEIIERESK